MESSPVTLTAGKTYRIGAWLRGELNEQAGQGDWRIRAQFYASNGTDLGYQEGCYGAGEHSVTWAQVKCYVKAPQNAATLRLQLWLVQNAGWVAFDDLTVDDLTIADWDGSTKYYTFNGQRIAMRQGSQLTYLHTDHLGSTKLLTDQAGNPVQPVAQYYAYGRAQAPGSLAGLPTDYTFTGQRLDNTGLIYMNARYYDPALGQFLSPDSLVPDATNLFDYNRYMYARGNPMRYADPSGHCGVEEIINSGQMMDSPCEMGGPEAAVETAMAADVESAAIAAQTTTIVVPKATIPLANAVHATDGTVVYNAPAPFGIEESVIVGEQTATFGVNPNSINFSQRSVSENVNQYTNDMMNGKWDWSKSAPVRVIDSNGQLVTYDNRRVIAAQNARLEKIPVEIVSPEDFMPGSKRTWEQAFTRRFNDPRNIELGGPVPLQGVSQQPIVSLRGPR